MWHKTRCCCFFGHRKIEETEKLKNIVLSTAENLIVNKNVDTFLFGSKSDFDKLCYKIITELKKKYLHIRRIYVRAEYPHINDSYHNFLLKSYEETYYPERIIDAGKAVYVERNYEMINKSSYSIVYYDENYSPPKRRTSKKDLTDYQPKSGTKIAYDYAVKKCEVVNVFRMGE